MVGGTEELLYFSRYDGLMFFRITPLGAYALGMASDYTPAPVETRPIIRVLPNLEIATIGTEIIVSTALENAPAHEAPATATGRPIGAAGFADQRQRETLGTVCICDARRSWAMRLPRLNASPGERGRPASRSARAAYWWQVWNTW